MNKLYNNFDDVASEMSDFLKDCNTNLSKHHLKTLPHIILGMISSESVVTADIASSMISSYFSNNSESIQKRIWRFMNNDRIDMNSIFNSIIRKVIQNISNVKHDKLVVTLDHMFTKNNFVTLMFTLKIDNQGIPIWFSTDRTLSNCHCEIQKHARKKVFSEKFIFDAVDEVIEILKPLNTKITFLADRWFFNLKLLKHINKRKHYFCIRAKENSNVKFLLYDKKEKHEIYRNLSYLSSNKHHSKYYEGLELGDMKFKCNISISRKIANEDEPWYIVSNIHPNQAIREYKHRFGCIEMFFKSQKTNGFYLESTKTKNLHAFENLYAIACIASLWLNIIAIDYIKNKNHVKNKINIRYNKKNSNGKLVRILSTFKLGLKLFSMVFKSNINYNLSCRFKLYL